MIAKICNNSICVNDELFGQIKDSTIFGYSYSQASATLTLHEHHLGDRLDFNLSLGM